MYRSPKYIHHQYFCSPDWSGVIFVSPTMAGSRNDLLHLSHDIQVIQLNWQGCVKLPIWTAATQDLVSKLSAVLS